MIFWQNVVTSKKEKSCNMCYFENPQHNHNITRTKTTQQQQSSPLMSQPTPKKEQTIKTTLSRLDHRLDRNLKMGELRYHRTIYPHDAAAVSTTLKACHSAIDTRINSGLKIVQADLVPNGVIINMCYLDQCSVVEKNIVEMQAGVCTKRLVEKLHEKKLFLPIGDNPEKSIVSQLLKPDPFSSPFQLSGGVPLVNRLIGVTVTSGDGLKNLVVKEDFKGLKKGEAIVSMKFRAESTVDSKRWLESTALIYSSDNLERTIAALCQLKGVDWTVRVVPGRFNVIMIHILVTSQDAGKQTELHTILQTLNPEPQPIPISVCKPNGVLRALVTSGGMAIQHFRPPPTTTRGTYDPSKGADRARIKEFCSNLHKAISDHVPTVAVLRRKDEKTVLMELSFFK